MAHVITDELDELDEAFAGNRLLSTFDRDARALVEAAAEIVRLNVGDPVLERGEHVSSSLFPFGPTMAALVVDLS
ncbi:hypothetical protein, partial [Sphingomonas sp.]|uniref:hypothetical protein n=1 Tax=Sphingomonas sp. TaxID=28214 RepID=UPI0025E7B47E